MGFDTNDDAAAVRIGDNRLLVQTVDFFTPIVDDPFQFGQIAAANSLSDIYAMGATPTFALNIFAFPLKKLPLDMASLILKGGIDKATEAGIPILGGHSIDDNEPKYGLVVSGEVEEDKLIKNSEAQAGDVLVLTKPLGTGIVSTAIKRNKCSKAVEEKAVESMSTLNKLAADEMKHHIVHAATDVTGFGLLGHLHEVCKASNLSCTLDNDTIPILAGVDDLASKKIIPGGTERNLKHAQRFTNFSKNISLKRQLMIADAQTSGGLLIALPERDADEYVKSFNSKSKIKASVIGRFTSPTKDPIEIV